MQELKDSELSLKMQIERISKTTTFLCTELQNNHSFIIMPITIHQKPHQNLVPLMNSKISTNVAR